MPLIDNKITSFTKKVADLPDVPSPTMTPSQIKSQFDSSPEELRNALNRVIDSVIAEYTNKTGDHQGSWQNLTPQMIGAPEMNSARITKAEGDLSDVMQVNFKNYGSTSLTDNSPALVSIISDAISKGYTTVEITVPKGNYKFTTPIVNTSAIAIIFKGKGKFDSTFTWRGGAGTFLTNNDVNDWTFKDIQIRGWVSGDTNYFVNTSIGIRTKGNLIMENVYLQGFQTLIYWDGAFYHQFNRCRFQKANKVMDNAYANGITFNQCRALEIDNFIVCSAGTGSLNISDCAFEQWTTTLFSVTSGAKPLLILHGNYIENYPGYTAGNGLAKPTFDTAFIASGFDAYSFIGNTFTTGGIRRIVHNSGVDTANIVSLGNIINYAGTTADSLEYAYFFQNLKSGYFSDYAKTTIPGTGPYTSKYIGSNSYANPEACKVYDPFTAKDISPEPVWTTASLLSSWAQNGTAGNNTISYRKIGNKVYLKGVIDGSAATANLMFTIPGLTLTKTSWKNTGSIGGTANINVRMLATGDVRCETMGVNGVILDNVSFDII